MSRSSASPPPPPPIPKQEKRKPPTSVDPNLTQKKSTQVNLIKMEVDIVFKLEIKRMPTPDGAAIGHNFLLVASKATSKVKESNLNIRHLVDLGVITFFENAPPMDQDMVCRVESSQKLWTARNGLIDIWSSLNREIEYYQRLHLAPPVVPSPRRLQFGVTGLKYFRAFEAPDLNRVPSTFICNYTYQNGDEKITLTALPPLFR